jgi:RNA polymerase sigma-70 factor (ECF subfamily)
MSTPYELPLEADLLPVPLDTEPALLPDRAPLRVVPDLDGTPSEVDFDDFVRRQSPRLRRIIMRKLGDISEAEEIAQETLLRAHQHLHTLRTENELIAWTTVVGQRLAIDRIRVRGRSVAVAEVPEDSRLGRDTADIVVARAEARTALEALESIPERQAAILWAREVEGLQYDAIAERFGISEPAVRSLLHRGRKALREEYAARGGTLPFRGLVPLAPGLLALRGLGRLRAAARTGVRSNVSAIATMSIASALALGMSFGAGGSPVSTPEQSLLGPSRTAQDSTAGLDLVAPPGSSADRIGSLHSAFSPTSAPPPMTLDNVSRTCTTDSTDKAQRVCVTSSEGKGDVLYIGPTLPTNPVIEQVAVSQTFLPVCRYTPTTPVTECRAGHQTGQSPTTPTLDTPSTVEGAQK